MLKEIVFERESSDSIWDNGFTTFVVSLLVSSSLTSNLSETGINSVW